MTAKPPTPQGISRLLAKAGFARGVSNPPHQACAGYAVIPNRPGDGIVLVNWWGTGQGYEDDVHAEQLADYAQALRDAGYQVDYARNDEYLIVTAPGEGQ